MDVTVKGMFAGRTCQLSFFRMYSVMRKRGTAAVKVEIEQEVTRCSREAVAEFDSAWTADCGLKAYALLVDRLARATRQLTATVAFYVGRPGWGRIARDALALIPADRSQVIVDGLVILLAGSASRGRVLETVGVVASAEASLGASLFHSGYLSFLRERAASDGNLDASDIMRDLSELEALSSGLFAPYLTPPLRFQAQEVVRTAYASRASLLLRDGKNCFLQQIRECQSGLGTFYRCLLKNGLRAELQHTMASHVAQQAQECIEHCDFAGVVAVKTSYENLIAQFDNDSEMLLMCFNSMVGAVNAHPSLPRQLAERVSGNSDNVQPVDEPVVIALLDWHRNRSAFISELAMCLAALELSCRTIHFSQFEPLVSKLQNKFGSDFITPLKAFFDDLSVSKALGLHFVRNRPHTVTKFLVLSRALCLRPSTPMAQPNPDWRVFEAAYRAQFPKRKLYLDARQANILLLCRELPDVILRLDGVQTTLLWHFQRVRTVPLTALRSVFDDTDFAAYLESLGRPGLRLLTLQGSEVHFDPLVTASGTVAFPVDATEFGRSSMDRTAAPEAFLKAAVVRRFKAEGRLSFDAVFGAFPVSEFLEIHRTGTQTF
ncbi:MAG: uncharacterized protein KVP18_000387 [Porospora cf. gigantea A]|uniref:uncharacterized protein n=1 Tax=Porospora cf. gigantea A TaxID=2853593 RepID=UPI00355938B9|nr:MAG: hypothetical protein KVP18_000387 [Porospora cf. gigantea A]